MSTELIIAGIVFVLTYALISVRRLPGIDISMPLAALIGAALMLLLGIASWSNAWSFINLDTLFILLGMMALVASLETCGFFDMVSKMLLRNCRKGNVFLARVMIASAVLSALVLNDAVVLLLTPVVIKCCRKAKADPVPFLLAVFISANIGSVATVVGNPQNAYIASKAGLDFITFSQYLLPLSIMCLSVSYAVILVLFRRRMSMTEVAENEEIAIDRKRLPILLALVVSMVALFAVSSFAGLKISNIALCCGAIATLIVLTKGVDTGIRVVKRIDWDVLLFFIGLFVVMAGVVESGLLREISNVFPGFSEGSTATIGEMTLFSMILSNLVSNVPSVMLIGEMIPAGNTALWLTLAASSTLAGNMTMVGAAANVIVSEESEKESIRIDFWKYLRIGVPLSAITILTMFVYLTLVL